MLWTCFIVPFQVGLSESNKMYVIVGNEERSLECVEFTAEQLRQLKVC